MIIGTGVDIIEVKRIERFLSRRPAPERIFTKGEIAACDAEGFSARRRLYRFAGLFAAKEAVMKALGTGWAKGAAFSEITISHTTEGKPLVELSGETSRLAKSRGVARIHVSISHSAEHALAVAVAEG